MVREAPLLSMVIQGIPTSITGSTAQWVVKLSKGPALAKASNKRLDFWEFLYSWVGKRMWEGIKASQGLLYGMTWVAEEMKNYTLIWVTDGSYDRKKAIDLCGVGRIIFCTKTGSCLTGTFWEQSNSTSAYRAEMLGLCKVHLLAWAVAEYYKVKEWSAMLCCDNKCARELSSHPLHCI